LSQYYDDAHFYCSFLKHVRKYFVLSLSGPCVQCQQLSVNEIEARMISLTSVDRPVNHNDRPKEEPMDWKDVGHAVTKVAPVLGAVLSGPIGAVATSAGALAASFLGTEPEPKALMHALEDPETMLRLKELEDRHRARLLEWQARQLELEVENTKSARRREIELAKTGSAAAWVTGVVALVVIVGFFGMLHQVLSRDMVNEPALILLGSLGTAFGAVVNYYLGSSLGSTKKTGMLEKAAGLGFADAAPVKTSGADTQ
jgi:hypothetical protein